MDRLAANLRWNGFEGGRSIGIPGTGFLFGERMGYSPAGLWAPRSTAASPREESFGRKESDPRATEYNVQKPQEDQWCDGNPGSHADDRRKERKEPSHDQGKFFPVRPVLQMSLPPQPGKRERQDGQIVGKCVRSEEKGRETEARCFHAERCLAGPDPPECSGHC